MESFHPLFDLESSTFTYVLVDLGRDVHQA
jgi:hypothetical protein